MSNQQAALYILMGLAAVLLYLFGEVGGGDDHS